MLYLCWYSHWHTPSTHRIKCSTFSWKAKRTKYIPNFKQILLTSKVISWTWTSLEKTIYNDQEYSTEQSNDNHNITLVSLMAQVVSRVATVFVYVSCAVTNKSLGIIPVHLNKHGFWFHSALCSVRNIWWSMSWFLNKYYLRTLTLKQCSLIKSIHIPSLQTLPTPTSRPIFSLNLMHTL